MKTDKITIEGRWQVVRLFIREGQQDGVLEMFPAGDYIWEFLPGSQFIEQIKDRGRFAMPYSCHAENRELHIDRRGLKPDDRLWARTQDNYRVTPVSATELYLHDLYKSDAGDFIFRHILLERI